jgi:hypothetical protein
MRFIDAARLAVLAVGLACSPAHAEWLVSLYTGTSHTRASHLRVQQTASDSDVTFDSVQWQPKPFEDAPYYGLSFAYFPSDIARWGGSFDYTHYKMYADTARSTRVAGRWNGASVDEFVPINSRIDALEISHGVNLISLNAERRWSFVQSTGIFSRVTSVLGAGLVGYGPHAEGSINGVPSGADYRFAGGGAQIFGTGEYRLAKHVGLFVQTKFDAGTLKIDLQPEARLETHTRTLHTLGGLSLHF